MGVLDEFAQYQQQIQEINAVRAQNISSGNAAAHNQIVYNTQKNIALKRAQSSANSVQQYKSWMQKTFLEQEHRTSKIQEMFQKTEYRITKTINSVMESMQNISKDVMETFSPEHLAETSTGQFRAFLYLLGTSALATNIDKITGWVQKIAGYFGLGKDGEGHSLGDTLSNIASGTTGNGTFDSLVSIVRAPIDYFINWIKGEFELRATMMKKVKMPTLEPVSLGSLKGDLLPFGQLLQSTSSYLSDVITSLGQKINTFFDPSSIRTIAGNNKIQSNAEEVRQLKAAKYTNENENGTLYVYGKNGEEVKSRNTVNFIPKVFLNAAGGLNGTTGSMLGASRQVYSLYNESIKAGRIDTSSLVDTLNKMYNTVKQKGYIIVEAAFLDTFSATSGKKYKNAEHEITIYIVKDRKNILETMGIGRSRSTGENQAYYLTESEWNNLNKDSQNALELLGTVKAYKLTEKEFEEFARDNYNVDNFDSMNNTTLITFAQNSLESVKNHAPDDKVKKRVINQVGPDRMDDKGIEKVYEESQELYRQADEERKKKLQESEAAQTLQRLGSTVTQAVSDFASSISSSSSGQQQTSTTPSAPSVSPGLKPIDYEGIAFNANDFTPVTKWNQEEADWIGKNSSMINTMMGGDFKAITSFWGNPRDGGSRLHKGIDLRAVKNTPVYAPESGTITNAKDVPSGLGGRHVFLQSTDGQREYFLCHLEKPLKHTGEVVKSGDLIAYSGASGKGLNDAYGPHIHFGLRVKSGDSWTSVDPLKFIRATEGMDYSTKTINPPKPIKKEEGGETFIKGYMWNPKGISVQKTEEPSEKEESPEEEITVKPAKVVSDVKFNKLPSNTGEEGIDKTEPTITTKVAESLTKIDTDNKDIELQKIKTTIEVRKAAIKVIGLAGEELAGKIDVTNQLLSSKQNTNPVDIRRR